MLALCDMHQSTAAGKSHSVLICVPCATVLQVKASISEPALRFSLYEPVEFIRLVSRLGRNGSTSCAFPNTLHCASKYCCCQKGGVWCMYCHGHKEVVEVTCSSLGCNSSCSAAIAYMTTCRLCRHSVDRWWGLHTCAHLLLLLPPSLQDLPCR